MRSWFRRPPPAGSEYLRRALQDARIVEVRHDTGAHWESGLFDRLEPLEDTLRARAEVGALYTTLNRPSARPVPNAMGTAALRDEDVATIVRLPFDFDPERPAKTASTDAEMALAVAARTRFVGLMVAHGWPMPALALSGNGAHALYRTCIPNSPEWRAAAGILYRGAAERLGDMTGVKLDLGVRNPARIWRCYGFMNRKGTPSDERPHRLATITLPAGGWHVVTPAQISRVVKLWTPKARTRPVRPNVTPIRGAGDYRTLDVARWFIAHGAYRRELEPGKHAVICPWAGEHTTDDGPSARGSVIWEGDGSWPTFHCSHAHCEGRTLANVITLWGDADGYCAARWEGRRHA